MPQAAPPTDQGPHHAHPAIKSALDTYWEDLVYLEAALLANPATVHLAEPVTALLRDHEALVGLDRGSRRAVVQARARAAVADLGLDDLLRGLHSALLHAVRQNRKSPVFRAVFDSDLSATLRFALGRQVEVAADIARRLGLAIVPADVKAEHQPKVQAAIDHGRAMLDGRRQAEFGRLDVRLAVEDWKQSANRVRQAVYGRLVEMAAEQGATRDWAEAYFASDEDETPPVAVAPAPVPAPVPEPAPV